MGITADPSASEKLEWGTAVIAGACDGESARLSWRVWAGIFCAHRILTQAQIYAHTHKNDEPERHMLGNRKNRINISTA